MPELSNLQRWLRWIVTEPRGVGPALENPTATEPRPRLLEKIVKAPPLSREERLDVYAEAYFARIADSLAKDFPALRKLLDEDPFRRLIADYLKIYPSHSFTIAEVGRQLPKFLSTYCFNDEIPYLAELARLEWALIESFYSTDFSSQVDLTKLIGLDQKDWMNAKLILNPSVRILKNEWPVDRIHDVALANESPEIEFEKENSCLLIHRRGYSPEIERLGKIQYLILSRLLEKTPLGLIFGDISDTSPDSIGSLQAEFEKSFQHWMSIGIIHKIEALKC